MSQPAPQAPRGMPAAFNHCNAVPLPGPQLGPRPRPAPGKFRRPVAVLLSRFPKVTETFILREVVEMERQGQPVHLVPLLRESPPVVHPAALPYTERALYTPFLSPAILKANLRTLWRQPAAYLRLLARAVLGSVRSLNLLRGALGIFPKSVYLAERLQAAGVDHVHAHYATHPALAAHVIGTLTGIPYSVTAHAHDIFVHPPVPARKLRDAAFVRAISSFNRDYLLRRWPDAAPEDLPVIRVGIDPSRLAPRAPDPVLDRDRPPAGRLRILCVAAFKPYKGLPVLVEACRRLRAEGVRFTATLVGDGPLRRAIERHIAAASLQDSMHLTGLLPEDQVAGLLQEADVLVQPSIVASNGQMEGIPVSLMEAMAAGVPVIASNISGIPELVRPGVTGWLVPPGEPGALAEALQQIGRQALRLGRLRAAARSQVERHHRLDRCVSELLACIDRHRLPLPPGWPERLQDLALRGPLAVLDLQDRRDSWIARLAPAPGVPGCIVKEHTARAGASRGPAARARHEYDVLLALAHDPPPRGCGVPRAVACQNGQLVLETAPGEPLEHLLRRARRPGRDGRAALRAALAAVHRSGRWLRWFQSRSVPGLPGEQEAIDARNRLRLLQREILTRMEFLGDGAAQRLAARIQALGARLTPASLRCTPVHGDFGPVNVLADRSCVTVLDFEGAGCGLPLEDVGAFLVQVGQFFCYPLLPTRARLLERAFLDGYLDGAEQDLAAAALGRMVTAGRLLADATASARPASPAARWRHHRLRRLLLSGASS